MKLPVCDLAITRSGCTIVVESVSLLLDALLSSCAVVTAIELIRGEAALLATVTVTVRSG
ncbi:MAG: hypothetical protein IPK27_18990 [Rhodanobacteraceae bacterium]|nr:hypothetical protein [Rhodanobacteraceae bacterium]